MKFGIFYEHQLPRPWDDDAERQVYHDALDQIELADDLGIDYVWEVEHHFLEEYSHSSAPEVFLAAAADRTSDIRLGHGIKLMPPPYNHPARAAEQVATLDLVSDGRVDYGTGESGSTVELGGFGIDPEEKYHMWHEGVEAACDMMTMEPYPGKDGEFFEMPARNVIPKPVQDPHPPLWMACSSREAIEVAAKHGVGALCFAFNDPEHAEEWVDIYYETFENECEPIGHSVNPNVAMVAGFHCHEDSDVAWERGAEDFAFFQYALAYYYVFGEHVPGESDIWAEFNQGDTASQFLEEAWDSAIGDPGEIREMMRGYEDAGVDQVILVGQGGNAPKQEVMSSMELFAEEVMGEFHDREEERLREKEERLAPAIERAMERKEPTPEADEDELPGITPYERDFTKYV